MVIKLKIHIFLVSMLACQAVALGIYLVWQEMYFVHSALAAVLIFLMATTKKEEK